MTMALRDEKERERGERERGMLISAAGGNFREIGFREVKLVETFQLLLLPPPLSLSLSLSSSLPSCLSFSASLLNDLFCLLYNAPNRCRTKLTLESSLFSAMSQNLPASFIRRRERGESQTLGKPNKHVAYINMLTIRELSHFPCNSMLTLPPSGKAALNYRKLATPWPAAKNNETVGRWVGRAAQKLAK